VSDLWKIVLASILTFCVTLLGLWLIVIKDHQFMKANVEHVCSQQVATWQKLGNHTERIVKLETQFRDIHGKDSDK